MQCRLLNIEFSEEFIIATFRVNVVIRNVGNYLPADKEWHPKRLSLPQDRCENLKSRKLLVTS